MDEGDRKLKEIGFFRCRWNETILPSDLTLAGTGSEFHIVGVATEKYLYNAFNRT